MTGDLTLQNYVKLVLDSFYLRVLLNTLWLAVAVTGLSFLLGFGLAYFLWRAPPRHKGWLTAVVLTPLLISIVAHLWLDARARRQRRAQQPADGARPDGGAGQDHVHAGRCRDRTGPCLRALHGAVDPGQHGAHRPDSAGSRAHARRRRGRR
ncbi:MAG: hypothetical protein WDO24_09920 [Pseudomonadota bacterium]